MPSEHLIKKRVVIYIILDIKVFLKWMFLSPAYSTKKDLLI